MARAGLRALLNAVADEQILEAANGIEALACLQRDRPDLVVLDLMLPGLAGLELLRQILSADPSARVVVLSMHAEPLLVARAMTLGAFGYLSKNVSADELLAAVRQVSGGTRYIESEVAQKLALQNLPPGLGFPSLAAPETEIMWLLADGMSLAEIADRLGVSRHQAARMRNHVMAKLGVSKVADLVRCAVWFDPI